MEDEIDITRVDIDGLIAIGQLSMFKELDTGSLKIASLQDSFRPVSKRTLHSLPTRDYDNWNVCSLGWANGIPFSWITNLNIGEFKALFLTFLKEHSSDTSHLGHTNAWIVGVQTTGDIVQRSEQYNRRSVYITKPLLAAFSNWAPTHLANNYENKDILAACIWYGQKMRCLDFKRRLVTTFYPREIMVSCYHVGLTIEATEEPLIILLRKEFFHDRNKKTCFLYNPMGLKDGFGAKLTKGNRVLHALSNRIDYEVTQLRAYMPILKDTRHHTRRGDFSQVTTSLTSVLGSQAQHSPYSDISADGHSFVSSAEVSVRECIQRGSPLRIELVLSDVTEFDLKYLAPAMQKFYEDLIEAQAPVTYSLSDMRLHDHIDPVIQLARTKDPTRLHITLAAEAYLVFLLDGGNYRAVWGALKSALDGTIVSAMARPSSFIQPEGIQQATVQWPAGTYLDKVAKEFASRLGVTQSVVKVFIDGLRNCPQDNMAWPHIIVTCKNILLSALKLPDTGLTRQYHKRRKTLVGSIEPQDLARVLVHQTPGKSFRSLISVFLRSYMHESGKTMEDLTEAIRSWIQVWPQSAPVASVTRNTRFWNVGQLENSDSLKATLLWIMEHCPISCERTNTITQVVIRETKPFVANAWHAMEAYIENGSIPVPVQQLRIIWVVVLGTILERKHGRKRGNRHHPYLSWGEWPPAMDRLWTTMDHLVSLRLLDESEPGDEPATTLFGSHRVPPDFESVRLPAFETLLTDNGWIEEPVLPVSPPPPIPLVDNPDNDDMDDDQLRAMYTLPPNSTAEPDNNTSQSQTTEQDNQIQPDNNQFIFPSPTTPPSIPPPSPTTTTNTITTTTNNTTTTTTTTPTTSTTTTTHDQTNHQPPTNPTTTIITTSPTPTYTTPTLTTTTTTSIPSSQVPLVPNTIPPSIPITTSNQPTPTTTTNIPPQTNTTTFPQTTSTTTNQQPAIATPNTAAQPNQQPLIQPVQIRLLRDNTIRPNDIIQANDIQDNNDNNMDLDPPSPSPPSTPPQQQQSPQQEQAQPMDQTSDHSDNDPPQQQNPQPQPPQAEPMEQNLNNIQQVIVRQPLFTNAEQTTIVQALAPNFKQLLRRGRAAKWPKVNTSTIETAMNNNQDFRTIYYRMRNTKVTDQETVAIFTTFIRNFKQKNLSTQGRKRRKSL